MMKSVEKINKIGLTFTSTFYLKLANLKFVQLLKKIYFPILFYLFYIYFKFY